MKTIIPVFRNPARDNWDELSRRPVIDHTLLEGSVQKIMDKVRTKGDKAVIRYTKKFDGVKLKKLRVSDKEISAAEKAISPELKTAIRQAKKNITAFHKSQVEKTRKTETMPGISCWRRSSGIEKVGIYIPGGSAPLFSTVLMLAIPAAIAGCKEIILCTPPQKDGTVNSAILYSASLCGITSIFKTGGVQAIAAMAYGTESITRVFKIFGPGNQYVTCAKQMIQRNGTAIDMPAGPSELLIIADETAKPIFVAADLLSQAEHGPDSQVLLLTTSELIADTVMQEMGEQLKNLPRKKMIRSALKNSRIILFESLEEALVFSNHYAPEHLILSCRNAEELVEKVISAGSVFIGEYSPEAAGDYASGTNHTLPTNGYAAMYSGVSVDSFVKKITFQQLSREGLAQIGETVMQMAAAEGLEAHKKAIEIRLKPDYGI